MPEVLLNLKSIKTGKETVNLSEPQNRNRLLKEICQTPEGIISEVTLIEK